MHTLAIIALAGAMSLHDISTYSKTAEYEVISNTEHHKIIKKSTMKKKKKQPLKCKANLSASCVSAVYYATVNS